MRFQKLQEFFEHFQKNIDITQFCVNLIVGTLLAMMLSYFYVRYANAVSNRKRFAGNFVPLALTTMLIITVVKSSIELSIGLVGALSIIRFRAAIKDPEELTYLFLVIGVGLTTGANHPVLAVFATTLILLFIFLSKLMSKKTPFREDDRIYVNISTDTSDLEAIANKLTAILPYVELKRMDTMEDGGLELCFICTAGSIQQLSQLKEQIGGISEKTMLSIIDQPDLIV